MTIPCTKKILLIALLAVAVAVPVSSRASYGTEGERRPPEPPQQAIDVCQGKTEGTKVEISAPDGGTVSMVCKQMGDRLVAVPEGSGPPPGNGEPPQQGKPGGE
jgi:hypothetical protein